MGMPVEEKKKDILQLQNSSSRLTAQRVCVHFLTGLDCIGHAFDVKQQQHRPITGYISQSDTERNSSVRTLYSSDTAVLLMK